MAVKISGVLKDGAGKPVQNCTIQLKAKRNSTTVVANTVASENPDEAGRYSMDVEYGQYSVILLVEGFPPSHAGTITVYEDSQPGTLNDFLGAMTEDDVRPEALRRFELMVEEVARNASAVAQNTAAAKKSASDAGTSAREAATRATDAAGSARAASTSAGQAASSAQSASSSAGTASTKATEASKSAAAAESSKSAAATSAGAAKTSEMNAAASQKSAATSASTATTKASEAATSARDASASKVAAKSSETSAASSAGSAASSATAAGNSAKAAKTSETNADNSAQAAADSQTASANSATAAKKSETNAKNSEAAAKVSETNAKASENKAKEYLDKVGGLVSPMTQYDWPVVTGNESFYIKIAKLSDPGSNNCHVTLMVTNGGDYGSPYGNIDFIEISARGLPSSLTADNVSRYLSIRRLGPTGLINSMQMRYGLVKGDGFIEVWAFQRAFINGAKVAVLAQTARTELYIPDGFVKQTAAPSGYVESPVVRIYDQLNKPTKADLGLENAMLTGAFGLGGSGIGTTGKMSDVEILKALRDKGGHFWRGDKPPGSTATIYSHGSGIFSRCGDTWSAINIDYSTAKIKIYAGNDARLNNGTFSVNELYGSANKPSKSDVGLGNVTNDAQVKKTGDTMTGDLTIKKGTPSVFLRADSGVTAVRFYTGDNTERGIIYAGPNTDSLGEVRIRAKTAGGTSGGDLVVRHDGRVEVRDLTVAYKIKSRTIEIANTDTDSSATTLSIYGAQHTPLVLTRSGSSENVSIGFKLDNVNPKYLGIDTNGDLAFGESPDQKQNSKLITQAKLDKGLTIGGQLAFKGTTAFSAAATFSAGIAGAIEPENIGGQKVDLNNLTIRSDAGAVKYYSCPSSGGGANITNKPDGVTGNFLLRVESTRKVSASDYANMQTLISNDTKRIYVRFVVNGNWTAWSQVVVSGWNQDITVRSLTTSSPVKSGGGRIDVLGSTSDYSKMDCFVRGFDSTGNSLAWALGSSAGVSKMLSLKNFFSGAEILLNGNDGAVQLKTGAVNGAIAQALTINRNEVNSTVDLTLTKQSGTGNRFVLQNSGNAELPFSVRVWGSSTRQNVFEVGTSAAYLFYAQKTTDGQNLTVNGSVNCTTLNQSSDRRLKENIEIIDNATDAIRKINGYTYTLKENGAHCAGVIAQEVEEAIPEAVGSFIHYGEELQGPTVDGNELREETRYLNVDYAAVTGLLVQVARETDDRVTALEEENTTLRENLATADTRISTLENQVSELVALVRQLTGSEH
ncbi:TPA: prophage tail fiber N-terminal domain-containing protein [Escherichia coli]|uniref:prophage tail fiber N-terminal domain-containing protein n=9 Tax=Escherichia coli TaxID=562 RepID=UPI000D01B75E|nr:prophage tail fiber N-terminal domain-containing protein [Escherichia coli]EFE9669892.1 peptidase S74 [Escherichia coli]EHH7428556.1 peptidase S74 [Escherichia coli]ELQ7775453.1 prophage tail fiber N-terminal domain-containing protein [Escherichia coli]MCD8767660.1 prophage tail fiber N-terminal domain-containing protein [Escherichia coli]MCX1537348.1 prophage tail fiber N-terminal domain-containing protein [Escherichia coli]